MLHSIKKTLIILLLLPLGACSTFSLFFDNLPFFAAMRFDRMFDISEQQEELVRANTRQMQEWMKAEGIKNTLDRLKLIRQLWQNGDFRQASSVFENSLDTSIDEFMTHAGPGIIEFLLTLDQGNAEHYRNYQQEKHSEWFEYASSQQDKTISRVERLEKWFGPLTQQQVSLVGKIARLLPNEQQIRIDNNQYWVERVLRASLQRDESALKTWLQDPSAWWQENYKWLHDSNRRQSRELISMMIETMNTEQQAAVLEVLDEWIDRLEDLLS